VAVVFHPAAFFLPVFQTYAVSITQKAKKFYRIFLFFWIQVFILFLKNYIIEAEEQKSGPIAAATLRVRLAPGFSKIQKMSQVCGCLVCSRSTQGG
jgi:hypothetical protein